MRQYFAGVAFIHAWVIAPMMIKSTTSFGDILFLPSGFEARPHQAERKPAGVSGGVARPQVLQYSILGAEKHSTCVLAMRPCRAERTAWGAVRMRLS
jgi:hypothetical protein